MDILFSDVELLQVPFFFYHEDSDCGTYKVMIHWYFFHNYLRRDHLVKKSCSVMHKDFILRRFPLCCIRRIYFSNLRAIHRNLFTAEEHYNVFPFNRRKL